MAARVRSPNYPALDLSEAIQRARQLYSKEKTAHTSPEVAVTAWGYKGLNGASAGVLSAVKHYGLLDSVGRDVKLSGRALTILLEPEESAEYSSAIQEAAREPKIFSDILEEYPSGLPSDQGLIAYLVRKQGFTEDGAKRLTAVLRATINFASEHDGSHAAEPEPERSASVAQAHTTAPALQPVADHQGGVEAKASTAHGRLAAPPGGHVTHYEHALFSRGAVATLSLAYEDLTPDDVDELYDWLDLLRRSMERRIKREMESGRPPEVAAEVAVTSEATETQ
jgi:hypothetical protein